MLFVNLGFISALKGEMGHCGSVFTGDRSYRTSFSELITFITGFILCIDFSTLSL